MKFSIITPTYKRAEPLRRALESVIQQTHTDWELIIVNDNPGDATKEICSEHEDERIIFLENTINSGVNYSRNRGLDVISNDSSYVIFLDDDDYLTPNALTLFQETLSKTPHSWLLSARGKTIFEPTTKTNIEGVFSYAWDYLITKKIGGDTTHTIAARYVNGQVARVRFPTTIKQAEEWLFYFELSLFTNPYYKNTVTTLTEGYADSGLNRRVRGIKGQLQTLVLLMQEGFKRNLIRSPLFYLYIILRFIRAFVKSK